VTGKWQLYLFIFTFILHILQSSAVPDHYTVRMKDVWFKRGLNLKTCLFFFNFDSVPDDTFNPSTRQLGSVLTTSPSLSSPHWQISPFGATASLRRFCQIRSSDFHFFRFWNNLQSKVISLASNRQPGGPGSCSYMHQGQDGPVIPPGTGFPLRRFLRLAGLRWRYSNPPPRCNLEKFIGENILCIEHTRFISLHNYWSKHASARWIFRDMRAELQQSFVEFSNMKFRENQSSGSRYSYLQDGRRNCPPARPGSSHTWTY
jgi:hypothetical protein